MAVKSLRAEVYELLCKSEAVTPAGVCYLLSIMDVPPVYEEAERALESLVRSGHAVSLGDNGMGREFALKPKAEDRNV